LNQDSTFPYIKKIKNIALIGISTAVPSPPFMCWGRVSKEQLMKLEKILSSIEKENNFVLLFLHHPIHHYGAFNHKGLLNKEELIETISKFNIHLIIHGHLHREIHNSIQIKDISVPCIGAPSGSRDKNSGLSYLEYQIDKINDKWNLKVYRREYNFTDEMFKSLILKEVSYD
jgi:Icc-related predicted phosphoesterase